MSRIGWGLIALALLILAVDLGLAHLQEWLRQRDLRIRNRKLNRYAMGAFRGTKDRFLS